MKRIKNIKKSFTHYFGVVSYGEKNYKFESDLKKVVSFNLKKDELLIRLIDSPLNPSDFYMHQGTYLIKKKIPHIAGSEGYGEIINVGNENYKNLIGKKGNCMFTGRYGSYASHSVCKIKNFFEFKIEENNSNLYLVNPLTAISFYKILENNIKCDSFLQTGASTVVGKLLLILNSLSMKKYNSINIVRNDKYFELLKSLGSSTNLNSKNKSFKSDLKKNIIEQKPLFFFDCIGGILTGIIINFLPNDSEIVIYGALANKAITGIDPAQLIFTKKKIRGFHLFNDFFHNMNINDVKEELFLLYDKSYKLKIIDKKFRLSEFESAIENWLTKERNYRIIFKM